MLSGTPGCLLECSKGFVKYLLSPKPTSASPEFLESYRGQIALAKEF